MSIKIDQKLKPFSHRFGARCVVLKSRIVVEIFPALIRIQGIEFPIQITGPVKEFTVQMDLERECIFIWMIAKEGYFRFKIHADQEIILTVIRSPKNGVQIGSNRLMPKHSIVLCKSETTLQASTSERLFLGSWKDQDWDLIQRRSDLKEILPILFSLGQKIPYLEKGHGGTVDLMDKSLLKCYMASFTDFLIPHLTDQMHQGIVLEREEKGDPMSLFSIFYEKMKQSILIERKNEVEIFSDFIEQFPSGKATHLKVLDGEIHLEWSKHFLRKMIFQPTVSGNAVFIFPKKIQRFRGPVKKNESLFYEAGKKYIFDRFQK